MSSSYVTTKQIAAAKETSTTTLAPAHPVTPVVQPPPPPKEMSQAAYQAAKKIVQEKFPNAKRISEMNEAPIGKNGDVFNVTLFVDSVENGSATRAIVQMKLVYDRGNWQLKEMLE